MCRAKSQGGRRCTSAAARTKEAARAGRNDEAQAKQSAAEIRPLLPVQQDGRDSWQRYGLRAGREREELAQSDADELVPESQQWARDLDRDERSWVRAYTRHGERINRHLIQGKSLDEPIEGSRVPAREGLALLDSALAKAESQQPHLTYRGYAPPVEVRKADDVVGWARRTFRVGEPYNSPSYMSVSHCPGIASNFADTKWSTEDGEEGEASHQVMFEVLSRKGAALLAYSAFENHERERLIPRNTSFQVVGVQEDARVRGRRTVLVQLVDTDEVTHRG
ncbi:ADP-ribosyltransferase [Streptomyces sp. NPDC101062]|uniref:ADP-ribosyltransferase n=1 Tax=unclassified Streptomyces TaxID=2593676 RepID=UPI0037F34CE0